MPCVRFLVSGHVQGVFFRASARDHAVRLGLGGTVRNLADGRVEVLACGKREILDAMKAWLWQGPPQANVESVLEETVEETGRPDGFRIV